MRSLLIPFGVIGALASFAGPGAAQNSNNTPLNNGGDAVFSYSDPSVGSVPAAGVFGDLYWRAHTGANLINDVDAALGGSLMEIDGYHEFLFDSDWLTTPSFYDRAHTGMVGLLPDLASLVAGPGITVAIGPSGLGSPCTIAPSICSPAVPGALCGPPGTVVGWATDITFGPVVGSGVVLTAAGMAVDDIATTWLVPGGMTVFAGLPGPCGLGDYVWQAAHSTDETQAALPGGINPSGGFQIAGLGLINNAVTSMAEGHETWRGNVVNVIAQTDLATGVQFGSNGGGALNGRNLGVGGGAALIGVELRDLEGSLGPNLGIVGASFGAIPNPGVFLLGANLLILPVGVFGPTTSLWQGPVAPVVYTFTAEGAFTSALVPIPPAAAGATLFIQGATFDLVTLTLDSTNRATVTFWP